ncbi:MAG: hypothetical protein WC137_00010 [Alphaproteobacteria bacterium]
MKARHRRKLFLSILSVFLMLFLAVIIVPPMLDLKYLRPNFEQTIKSQTGINAKINGRINISLLRNAHIVVHDVRIPNGTIDSIVFTIPLMKIFDINRAETTGKIYIDGANITIYELTKSKFDSTIEISDSNINFMGRNFKVLDAILKNGNINAWIREKQHKYLLETNGDQFLITNKNEGLKIDGTLTPNGGATANMSIDTDDINSWFEFFEPDINRPVSLSMKVDWNGKYGFNFSDINGTIGNDKFNGSIILPGDDSFNKIDLSSDNMYFDLSFLLSKKSLLKNTRLDLNLHGNIKFSDTYYSDVKLNAFGTDDRITIENLDFKNEKIGGNINGNILGTGAQNLNIRFSKNDANVYCLFSGTPERWRCDEYEYNDKNLSANGTLVSDDGSFKITLSSKNKMPENFDFVSSLNFLGTDGTIVFKFADMGGEIKIINKHQIIKYDFVKDKNLDWLNKKTFNFLPESMRAENGFMKWQNNSFSFMPNGQKWNLRLEDDKFILSGNNELELLHAFNPDVDMPFINKFPYEISGKYSASSIKDLEIRMAGHVFNGVADGANITLKTDSLNLDLLANKHYFDNYDEMQFLSGAPVLAPFKIKGLGISLTASDIIWRNEMYDNFVYSLHDGTQDFSITDDARGSLLVSLKGLGGNEYGVLIKLNRFAFVGSLLNTNSPLNISDSVITGGAELKTNGKIAYDFWKNMKGSVELSFDGGILNGIGTDAFYAKISDITNTSAEDAIANAISGGKTKVKTLRIVGKYNHGKFETTQKLSLKARHTDIYGNLQLEEGKLSAQLDIFMHGASVQEKPISLKVLPNGEHRYSLAEIMRTIDIPYMEEFIRTHNQF